LADRSLVSVVIPALDEAAAIGDVVGLRTTAPWREVLVVDVGSSDRTAELAQGAGARVVGRSKIRLSRDGATFLLIVLKIATLFSPLRVFLPIGLVSALLGALYGVWNVVAHGRIPNGAVVLILLAALVFFVGLVSEQVASLRFERRSER